MKPETGETAAAINARGDDAALPGAPSGKDLAATAPTPTEERIDEVLRRAGVEDALAAWHGRADWARHYSAGAAEVERLYMIRALAAFHLRVGAAGRPDRPQEKRP